MEINLFCFDLILLVYQVCLGRRCLWKRSCFFWLVGYFSLLMWTVKALLWKSSAVYFLYSTLKVVTLVSQIMQRVQNWERYYKKPLTSNFKKQSEKLSLYHMLKQMVWHQPLQTSEILCTSRKMIADKWHSSRIRKWTEKYAAEEVTALQYVSGSILNM